MSGISRVIVGASGSPSSLQALRYAEQLAHAQCPVLAIPPPASARDLGHRLTGRMHWHRPLTVGQLLGDRGTAA